MASYTSNPDYQTYKVDPYQLPAQQIVQAISTRNAYWDQGASQLKNAYQNFLNLDLTRKDNKDKLDSLMQGVNSQLKKSSRTDLSLSGNVNDAMGAFEPIYKNDDIMGDNAITQWYKKQMSVADSYRNKDNGKGYSDMNVKYLMQGLQDYATDPNGGTSGNWRKYFNQRKEYSPFHDVGSEVHTLLKDYKPTTFTKNEPVLDANGKPTGYFRKVVDKEQTENELNSYLQSNLSDTAKQQMRINGSVMYNKNYAEIGKQVYYDNANRINTLNTQVSKLTADLKNPKATPEEKAAIQTQLDSFNSDLADYKDQNNKVKGGDYSFIKDNYDAYAGSTYARSYIKGVAGSNARKLEVSDTLSPDEVALTALREANKFTLEGMKQRFTAQQNALDREIARLKISASFKDKTKLGLNPDGTINPNEMPSEALAKTGDESANQTTDYLDWLTEKNNSLKSSTDAVSDWRTYMTNKAKEEGIDTNNKDELDRYVSTFEKNNPNDPTFLSYQRKVEDNDFRAKALDWVGSKAEAKLTAENKDSIDKAQEESKQYNPNVQKLVKSMMNGSYEYDTLGNVLDALADNNVRTKVSINGNTVSVNSEDWRIANKIAGNLGENLQERRKALLSAEYSRFKGYKEFTDPDNAGFKKLEESVTSKLGVKDKDITVRGYDRDGKIFVQVNTSDPKQTAKFTEGLARLNQGVLTPDQSYRKDKGLFVIANSNIVGFKLNKVSDPKIDLLKGMAELEEQQNPNKNSYFVQPSDWPLKVGGEYYKFEMHYVDGKEHWYPVHAKSNIKIREENGGYDTIEQAVAELSNPNNTNTIRQIILAKKPDYKF